MILLGVFYALAVAVNVLFIPVRRPWWELLRFATALLLVLALALRVEWPGSAMLLVPILPLLVLRMARAAVQRRTRKRAATPVAPLPAPLMGTAPVDTAADEWLPAAPLLDPAVPGDRTGAADGLVFGLALALVIVAVPWVMDLYGGGTMTYVVVFAFLAVPAAMAPPVMRRTPWHWHPHLRNALNGAARSYAAAMALLILLTAALVAMQVSSILQEADRMAAGDPYCLQFNTGAPVRAAVQLSALTFQKHCNFTTSLTSPAYMSDGTLLVDNGAGRLASHEWCDGFGNPASPPPRRQCIPQPNYAAQLPWFFGR